MHGAYVCACLHFLVQLLHKKIKVLERKIAEHEREAGGSLPEVQDAFAASTARMGREGRRAREALSMFQVGACPSPCSGV